MVVRGVGEREVGALRTGIYGLVPSEVEIGRGSVLL